MGEIEMGEIEMGEMDPDLGHSALYTRIHRDPVEVARLIAEEAQIVAIWQGESEIGPRALGNRSILFDPRNEHAQSIVNIAKGREPWRPFAGTILIEYAKTYFEMLQLKDSPYMSYALKVKDIAWEKIPGIVNFDGTCRAQTLDRDFNPNYYELIEEFFKLTEVPVLFNTSFNLGGEAMVESIYDAIDVCNRSEINHLYIPADQDVDVDHLHQFIKSKDPNSFV